MEAASCLVSAILPVACLGHSIAQESAKPEPARPAPKRAAKAALKKYDLGPDSLPHEGVTRGKLEGPKLFHRRILANTTRKYGVYVPARYDPRLHPGRGPRQQRPARSQARLAPPKPGDGRGLETEGLRHGVRLRRGGPFGRPWRRDPPGHPSLDLAGLPQVRRGRRRLYGERAPAASSGPASAPDHPGRGSRPREPPERATRSIRTLFELLVSAFQHLLDGRSRKWSAPTLAAG